MEDTYVIRDEKRIVVMKGRRSGESRRTIGPSPRLRKYGEKIFTNRREHGERRHKPVLTFKEKLYERLSCLTNGLALLAVGLFFLLTGLTFLPVVGIIVGGYVIIQSIIVMARSLQKVG